MSSMLVWIRAFVAVACLWWATPSLADAQQGGKGPRVIQLEEIKIEGRVQKPNAFYILNRSNLGYEVMDLRTSFLRKIVQSVRQEPF